MALLHSDIDTLGDHLKHFSENETSELMRKVHHSETVTRNPEITLKVPKCSYDVKQAIFFS